MYQPQIISEAREGSSARLRLRISPELRYFAGHFPVSPVLPGVVQIHWVTEIGRRLFGALGEFSGIDNLKFHQVVTPNMELDLVLTHDAQARRLDFSYVAGETKFSSGRLVFVGAAA